MDEFQNGSQSNIQNPCKWIVRLKDKISPIEKGELKDIHQIKDYDKVSAKEFLHHHEQYEHQLYCPATTVFGVPNVLVLQKDRFAFKEQEYVVE